MADAPDPITAPPAQGFQPYDATAPGGGDAQSAPESIYAAAGGSGAEPWVKVQAAGAVGSPGTWPDDGTSSAGAWKQT